MNTSDFIRLHRGDDVRALALQAARYPDVDMPFALRQIQGWQIARKKIPTWAKYEEIVYPPHLNMEQCSSEQTARYKASLFEYHPDKTMADLTGGLGVDFSFLSQRFGKALYVERDPQLCAISSGNFNVLQLSGVVATCDNCETFLQTMPAVDLLYIDPARRNHSGARTFAIADCTPDLLRLLPTMLEKASGILVKLSPMLDISKTVADLNNAADRKGRVTQVHVVSVRNECKELLVEMTRADRPDDDYELVLVNDSQTIRLQARKAVAGSLSLPEAEDFVWLYEPNVSILKAGCTSYVAERHHVKPVSGNSHLCVARKLDRSFPGRFFSITGISTMNKRSLKTLLQGIDRANVAVRNFPLTADQLRKQLHLKDGGDDYLFGTTLADGSRVVIACHSAPAVIVS